MATPHHRAHVDVFGVVPVTGAALLVLGCGLVVTAIAWGPVVARTGWRPVPVALAGVWLAVTAALTLGPSGNPDTVQAGGCPLPTQSVVGVLLEVGHDRQSALNTALLLPLGLTLVMGIRRVLPPTLVVVVLPGVIEATQLAIPGRVCSPADYLLNVAGGLVGVGLGALAIHWPRPTPRCRRR